MAGSGGDPDAPRRWFAMIVLTSFISPQEEKYEAIVEDIRDLPQRGQPVLVGTTSIETSELLSGVMTKEQIPHQVLNAKQHEREAHIIEQAGRPGAVTIATNMAGRGTDIVLGGSLRSGSRMSWPTMTRPVARPCKLTGTRDTKRRWRPVACTSLVPSVMNRGVSTTSCAAAQVARVIRVRAASILSLQDDLMRIFASDRVVADAEAGHGGG